MTAQPMREPQVIAELRGWHAEGCESLFTIGEVFAVGIGDILAVYDELRATLDVQGYAEWVKEWMRHPGFDWCLIPDVIDGTENDNAAMIAQWRDLGIDFRVSVPVWHLHESLERLAFMAIAWPRIALGSSGEYATVGTEAWWHRMGEAMGVVCDEYGRPKCKLHGLRMLNPEVFTRLPLASADSTNVARNHARETQRYRLTDGMGAIVVTGRVEANQSASVWTPTAGQLALDVTLSTPTRHAA